MDARCGVWTTVPAGAEPHIPSSEHQTDPRGSRENTTEERDEMPDTQVVWLTQESYDKLKTELDQLIAHRPVIAAEINDRREEGDLRENGGITPPGNSRARRRPESASCRSC